MARRLVTIHHPDLHVEDTVGPGFAAALIEKSGWVAGPLPDDPPDDDVPADEPSPPRFSLPRPRYDPSGWGRPPDGS